MAAAEVAAAIDGGGGGGGGGRDGRDGRDGGGSGGSAAAAEVAAAIDGCGGSAADRGGGSRRRITAADFSGDVKELFGVSKKK